uniref:Uncharacterized protein n=1 Tax=Serratia phage Spe5P4 TaxID=3159438 RepID=A0AAU7VH46_9CAUD
MHKYILTPELIAKAIISDLNVTLEDYLKDKHSKRIISGGEVSEGYYPEFDGEVFEVIERHFSGTISAEIFSRQNILAVAIYDTDYIFNLAEI